MRQVRQALQWARLKVRRLRALGNDEDHDDWLDDHRNKPDKPPNVIGPVSQ